ncbi:MAG: glycosyl transferase family 1 [Nitrospirales bacterium]|nr:MAG: glycosyl transferase family 1 [Nitrospirales bacterium]
MLTQCDDFDEPPVILHLVFRLAMGGLENGLVNLINHMPVDRYRHVIVCLTDFTDFRDRITRADVEVVAIHKKSGKDWGSYVRVWNVLKDMKPTILHTRNLPTMEYAIVATLAGVPCRIHGEHGRDIHDQYGASLKFRWFRKFVALWIQQFITVSEDLAQWCQSSIGINGRRISQIYNGVDIQRFHPRQGTRPEIFPKGFAASNQFIIGTIGRLQKVKDQITLMQAFIHLREHFPDSAGHVRLILVGDGPLRADIQQLMEKSRIAEYVWMPGERQDIPDLLRSFDLFVLPSEAEGISNTILEAMASGLPVLATAVGGNTELVIDGDTGSLVPPKDPRAMADAMVRYVEDKELLRKHGKAGRVLSERRFSLEAMVNGYLGVYDAALSELSHDTAS